MRHERVFELEIQKLVYGGAGLGRHDGKVVFVPFTVPGDRLLVRVVEQKKNLAFAEIVRILKPGPARVAPVCSHFGRCGGCQWQQVDYACQVEVKRSLLEETLHHNFPESRELRMTMRASPRSYGYRSRARIQVHKQRDKRRIGFFRHRSHEVEDIAECPLFRPSLNRALSEIRDSAETEKDAAEFDLAGSEESGQWVVATAQPDSRDASSRVTGCHSAEGLLGRRVGSFDYRVSAASFFQANDWLVEDLTQRVVEFASDAGGDSAIELYAGVGLFTLPLSRRFRRLIAVELSEPAAALCLKNLETAGVFNVEVAHSDVLRWLAEARPPGRAAVDLIVLDPPRAGAGADVMDALAEWNPAFVIYVSCDLHTLSRDAARLRQRGYRIDRAEGFDLFPQTYHFETVVRLRRG